MHKVAFSSLSAFCGDVYNDEATQGLSDLMPHTTFFDFYITEMCDIHTNQSDDLQLLDTGGLR